MSAISGQSSTYDRHAGTAQSFSHGVSGDFLRLTQIVSTNIHKINQNVSQMQRMINQIGGQMDNLELRDRLHHIQHYTNQLAKETNQYTRDLAHLPQINLSPSELRQRRVHKERLMNEFTSALSNFQSAQRLEKEREKQCIGRSHPIADPFSEEQPADDQLLIPNDGQSSLEKRQQCQTVMTEDSDLELLQDHEQSIRKLEEDIVAVNQIFKDLGLLVHEQGDVIDSIEANIENASMNVVHGSEHIRQARSHLVKVRRRKCYVAVVVVAVLTVLAIIIGIAVSR